MSQHVFYSYDPTQDSKWAYRSFPIACYGLADSAPAARAEYKELLSLALEEGETSPRSTEHIEQRHPAGFWVRVRVGDEDQELRQRLADTFVNSFNHGQNLRGGTFEIDSWSTSHLGEPIVIVCLPTDSIDSIVDEIGLFEACAVALVFLDPATKMSATWLSGIAREGAAVDRPVESLTQAGLDFESSMLDFMQSSGITREKLFKGEIPIAAQMALLV
ncbi:hypothetical protein ACHIPZ_13595 [Antrihabitans sp. NCIMB 15449]|uniref:Uncharacterized protein n=1 Tax=Antrihabitans spumae TaxID=3373370 RepID=A0ABW7JRP1_9NOCA